MTVGTNRIISVFIHRFKVLTVTFALITTASQSPVILHNSYTVTVLEQPMENTYSGGIFWISHQFLHQNTLHEATGL